MTGGRRARLGGHGRYARGVALVTGLCFLTASFFLAAVSIDLVMVFAAVHEAKNNAKLAALAAVEGYYADPPAPGEPAAVTHRRRLLRAEENARAVLTRNRIIRVEGGESVEPSTEEGAPVILVPGSYTYLEGGSEACVTKAGLPPCFAAYDAQDEPVVTAFLIRGNLYTDVVPVFRRFGGAPVAIRAEAVATIAPKLFSVLLDRSLSTTYFSHSQSDGPDYRASRYSFRPASFAAFPKSGPRGSDGLPSHPRRHYATDTPGEAGNDFAAVSVMSDAEYSTLPSEVRARHPDPSRDPVVSSSPVDGVWVTDVYRDRVVTGPEPFESILRGFGTAVGLLSRGARFGDEGSFVAFSDRVYWPSVVLPSSDAAYLSRFATLSGGPSSPAVRHGLFPMDDPASPQFTNAHLALSLFRSHLAATRGKALRGSPVVITDGVHNCAACAGGPLCASGFRCENTYDTFEEAMRTLSAYVEREVVDRHPVHVMLVGPGAHVRNIPGSGPGGCVTPREAERRGIIPVLSEPTEGLRRAAFDAQQAGRGPFLRPAALWHDIARRTGGVFAGVRRHDPLCDDRCDGSPARPVIDCSRRTTEEQVTDAFEEVFTRHTFRVPYSK